MSTLAIILVVLGVVVVLLLFGGVLGARRREHLHEADYGTHLRAADQALEQARALDRGWDRAVLEQVARSALEDAHPGAGVEELVLVLVDDRPGVEEDRAHFKALAGDADVRVVLLRDASGWGAESIH